MNNFSDENNKKYEFYVIGQRHAKEALVDLLDKTRKIREEYGEEAAFDYEVGIVSTISDYEYVSENSLENIDYKNLSGTLKYGRPNERNNSYFGGIGISKQYITDSEGNEVYNEPKRR